MKKSGRVPGVLRKRHWLSKVLDDLTTYNSDPATMPLFETPGWTLSPGLLKTQASNPAPDPSSATSKKRKRKNKSGKEEVSADNVAQLWRQHVEGIAPPVPEKSHGTGANSGALNVIDEDDASGDHKKKKQKQEKTQKNDESAPPSRKPAKPAKPAKPDKPTSRSEAASLPLLPPPPPPPVKPEIKLTPLQAAMRQKLVSARFRHLNETLYTTESGKAQALLEANPTFFDEYHSGFRQQVQAWPQNPVDGFVEDLKQRGDIRAPTRGGKQVHGKAHLADAPQAQGALPALPRTSGTCIVADLGCGDAKLANQIKGKIGKKSNIKILSYDLQSPNSLVTKADISNLPLEDGAVDIAIFCLALMGTNWIDFVEEAWRVLHWKGELWIAEIKSRFGKPVQKRVEHSVGNRRKKPSKAETQKAKEDDDHNANEQLLVEVDGADGKVQTDVTAFVEVLRKRGFVLQAEKAVDMSNKMFVKMRFLKALAPSKGKNVKERDGAHTEPSRQKPGFVDRAEEEEEDVDEASVLKPCLYKIR